MRTDNMHANATLTPLTRAQMALQHTEFGFSLRTTAVAFGVCEKTVRRWLARAQQAGFPQRLHDHSSRPLSQPRKTSSQLEAQILVLRRQRRSYAQIRMVLPVSKATLARVLRRHHLNRLSSLEPPKPPVLRYEREAPGDLLHLELQEARPLHSP
ncbi:MAG: helix-turn-helix domain-containing protein, partial [Chthoniobacterales bacterium]|nr:helix-turn-helix domain-containing protein [Chthoniobacterales bacterium]